MQIRNVRKIDPEKATVMPGVTMRVAISAKEGAPHFSMRYFEVDPGGATADHSHEWEHEVYVAKGKGEVMSEGVWRPIETGDTVYVPPNERHQFRNTGTAPLEFICVVPHTD
jgi:quercetin dioxygenase-like cupin family protein